MAYRSSAGLILIFSAFTFVLGLWRFARSGRWGLLAVVITAFFGYVGLLYAVYLIPDPHLRLWTAVVVVFGFPVGLMAGPLCMACRRVHQDNCRANGKASHLLAAFGIGGESASSWAWLHGATVRSAPICHARWS